MITSEKQKWLDHLSDEKTASVIPWDPACVGQFEKTKKMVQETLGAEQPVVHRGASSLGISGQNEIDAYAPVAPADFDQTVEAMKKRFGEPASFRPPARARFVIDVEGKHVDVFIINREHPDWTDMETFQRYLTSHPAALEEYRRLKESLSGKSIKQYYTEKVKFIDKILEAAKRQ